jgi:hypothetical protein
MSVSLIGKDGAGIATVTNGVPVFTGNAASPAGVGAVRMFSENDPGDILGTPSLSSPETSQDYRLRVGLDAVLLSDTFNASAQNTNIWQYNNATTTITWLGGSIQLGTTNGTTTSHGANVRTYSYFPLNGTTPLCGEFHAGIFAQAMQSNEVVLMGFGVPGAAQTPPTDGVWLQLTSAGIVGVISYNGTATQSGVLQSINTMTLGTVYRFTIVIGEREVEYWRDDVLIGVQTVPAANGQPFIQGSLPAFAQKFCAGAVGASTSVVRLSDVTVTQMDAPQGRTHPQNQATAGLGLYVAQNGHATQGTTATWPASTNPTTALPVNTALTANLPAGIGGQGLATLWNLAATDMVMLQYLNPASTVNITGRNLMITGVKITAASFSAAWTAPAAGAHLFQWGLAFGHSAATLATVADSATAHGTRRKAIGLMGWSSTTPPVGTYAQNEIEMRYETPLIVPPGTYLTVVCKMLNGAATATGGMYFTVDFDGYFE